MRWKQKKREKDGIPKPEVTSERVTNSANNQALTLPMRKYEKKEKKKKMVYPRAMCPNCKERFGVMKLASHFQECRATRKAKNLRDVGEEECNKVGGHGIFGHHSTSGYQL